MQVARESYLSSDLEQDRLLTRIIDQFSDNDYVYCLKFRELLLHYRSALFAFIQRVFSNVQRFLRRNNYDNDSALEFCQNAVVDRRRRPYRIPAYYDFTNWEANYWKLALCFSPSFVFRRAGQAKVDVPALLEIIENCDWFSQYSRQIARSCINAKNNYYGHVAEFRINKSDLDDSWEFFENLKIELREIDRIRVYCRNRWQPLRVRNIVGAPRYP